MKRLLLFSALLLTACHASRPHFTVGVSQCSDDAWRQKMNNEMQTEALLYDNLELEIRSAGGDSERQIADIRHFIEQGVDLLIVAPCTGNTLGKLANGIADSPVSFACKAHLRNGRPVLLAVSTNDGLSGSAANLGALLARRHFYFVPFGQDSPTGKPASLVAHFSLLPEAAEAALRGEQLQPLLV